MTIFINYTLPIPSGYKKSLNIYNSKKKNPSERSNITHCEMIILLLYCIEIAVLCVAIIKMNCSAYTASEELCNRNKLHITTAAISYRESALTHDKRS